MRAQWGTSTIKQEDHHEHEGKGQRHRIEICWRLLSDLGVLHCGMMITATKMQMIVQQYVLPRIRSSTVPGRVANCSRLPIEGMLVG